MLALVTMLVGSILALAMLQAGNSYFLGEDSRTKKRAATNMAQAGIEYAYYQVHYQVKPLPYSADVTLSTGSFHVDATDDGARDPSTMLITSTGTCGSYSYTIKRVSLGLLPYHYAWCEKDQINIGYTLTSTSQGRGMRANDSINLTSIFNNVNTGLWSTGTITALGTATPRNPSSPPIAFPTVDYTYYNSIATATYGVSTTFTTLSYPSDGVVVVNGNATINLISGKYRGAVTVVATGNITITSNLAYYDVDSYLALITTGNITVQSTASSVVATLYAHKSDNSANIILLGTKTLVGTVSGDNVTTDHSVDFRRDSGLNLDIMRRLRLPGL
jgi:hypothetical protein